MPEYGDDDDNEEDEEDEISDNVLDNDDEDNYAIEDDDEEVDEDEIVDIEDDDDDIEEIDGFDNDDDIIFIEQRQLPKRNSDSLLYDTQALEAYNKFRSNKNNNNKKSYLQLVSKNELIHYHNYHKPNVFIINYPIIFYKDLNWVIYGPM